MILYTVGFTQKNSQEFFGLLKQNKVKCLVDIRLKPPCQLSGFAKQDDLPYILHELAGGCAYLYLPLLAPTMDILEDYRKDGDSPAHEQRFENLMDKRDFPDGIRARHF